MPVPGYTYKFIPAAEHARPETLLLLHGTGGDENDLIELGAALLPGAALLSPRGKVLENGMPRFFRRLAPGVFDTEDLEFRAHELADFVLAAAEEHGFDATRVIAVGFSNGANIAAAMLLLLPAALSGAVLFHPQVPLEPRDVPDLKEHRIFIGAGRFDPIVPATETERLARMLRAFGADVELHWESTGHGLTDGQVGAAAAWFEGLGAASNR